MSLHVRNKKYRRTFDDIAANQRDLVFALTPADARPEPTPEEQAERSYFETCRERFNTLVNRPAPQLTVAEWLSGPPVSIEDLKGKTIALHFWTLNHKHHVRQIRLLQILQEVYRDKGLVCVAICPAEAEIETINDTSQNSRCLTQLAWTSQQRSSAQKAKHSINTLLDGAINSS